MSVDVGSMPPWKRELLERKRRQEEEEKRRQEDELEKLSHMPPWKRDLILRKHKKVMFFGTPASGDSLNTDQETGADYEYDKDAPRHVNGTVSVAIDSHVTVVPGHTSPRLHAGADTTPEYDISVVTGGDCLNDESIEHIIPIDRNPWFKSDPIHQRRSHKPSSSLGEHEMANDTNLQSGLHAPKVSSDSSSLDIDKVSEQKNQSGDTCNDDTDSVFGEEEVTYGKGFVHKLLRRFKHMTAKDTDEYQSLPRRSSPKRTQSTDNILEVTSKRSAKAFQGNRLSVGNYLEPGYSSLSKQKALSVDNLLTRPKSGSFDSTSNNSHLSTTSSEENLVDDLNSSTSDSISPRDNIKHKADTPDSGVLLRSPSEENVLEELPRENIVSEARSVFERISSPPPIASSRIKKKQAPEPPRLKSTSTSSTSSVNSLTSPLLPPKPSSPEIIATVNSRIYSLRLNKTDTNVTTSKSTSVIPDSDTIQSLETDSSEPEVKSSEVGFRKITSTTKHNAHNIPETKADKSIPEDINANRASSKFQLRSASVSSSKQSWLRDSTHQSSASTVYKSDIVSGKQDSNNGVTGSTVTITTQETNDQETGSTSQSCSKPVSSIASTSIVNKTQAPSADEAPLISEEVMLHSDKSALYNDNTDRSETSEEVNSQNERDSKSSHKSIEQKDTKDTVTLTNSNTTLEHRNPEANRLNLNLNLNELNRKKTTEQNTDINRNNKNVITATNTINNSVTTNGAVDNFPIPSPRRSKKKEKRPAPSGPGSMLVRPASNLVAAGTKTEYLILNKYQDIKRGEFAPAKKRPSYYEDSDDEDMPTTDIDDYIGNIPVTNIDDVSPSSTPREGEPNKQQRRNIKKFEFEGAGVIVKRSLLNKTRTKKLKLNFNDASIVSMFEYPSEQSLLDTMSPEPGDFDYRDPNAPAKPLQNGSVSDDEPPEYIDEPSSLKSTPGVGSSGSLGSYQSKNQIEYYFGMEREQTVSAPIPPPQPEMIETDVLPAIEDDFTWSDAASSDLLF